MPAVGLVHPAEGQIPFADFKKVNWGIPYPIVKAAITQIRGDYCDFSVTELVGAPRALQLRKRHDFWVDPFDRIWAVLGSAVHHIVESNADPEDTIAEHRLLAQVMGQTVGGTPDLYIPSERTLYDFKVTGTYKYEKGEMPMREWIYQLNLYRHIGMILGILNVERMVVNPIFRDWKRGKAEYTGISTYPPRPVLGLAIPRVEVEEYLPSRVEIHLAGRDASDYGLPECSDEERWVDPPTFKVYKKGGDRAVKGGAKLANREEAEKFIDGDDALEIREMKSNVMSKCRFCEARPFCNQYARLAAENPGQAVEE